MTPGRPDVVLALDTATRRAAVALGTRSGQLIADRSWDCGFRHGQEVLSTLDDLLARSGVDLGQVRAVVVGTGPGAFTGLRVGIATAKALAHGLGCRIVGIASTLALADAAWHLHPGMAGSPGNDITVIMPAGPHDRYVARYGWSHGGGALESVGQPELIAETDVSGVVAAAGPVTAAVDLAVGGPIDEPSVETGRRAQEGVGAALIRLGCARIARGDLDDVAGLVPAYVTLPRGIAGESGKIAWSSDRR